ncbi:MAG: M48 family metallopeptidase [Hyphomicrobiaceae bacterium]|nr:M48 family metallopeptidase [Hyphomicrobiaceae bacterium]
MPSISMPSEMAPAGATVTGRFSDGRSAASETVNVALMQGHLVIERAAGIGRLAWPLTVIETGEPVTRRSVDVLIHEPGRAGATLFVANPDFVKALGAAAPHVTGAATRWKAAQPFVVVAACVALLIAGLAAIDFSPARTVAGLIPQPTRALLGKQVLRSMVPAGQVCDNAAGVAVLAKLTETLSTAAGGKRSFSVTVSGSPVVNAFAAPGEQIVLMNGAIQQASSPDEVAGILAHEMGHGIELHPEAGIVRTVGLAVAAELMLGGTGGGSLGNIGVMLANLGYSRTAEREADRHALSILKAARISPEGLGKFFERMERRERPASGDNPGSGGNKGGKTRDGDTSSGDIPGFDLLRTHPSNVERLKEIKAAIGTYSAIPALDAADWAALRSICGEGKSPLPAPSDKRQRPEKSPLPGPPGDRSPRDI